MAIFAIVIVLVLVNVIHNRSSLIFHIVIMIVLTIRILVRIQS